MFWLFEEVRVKLFLGSSSEAIGSVRLVASWLENLGHEPIPWDRPGLFLPGEYTFLKLIEISKAVDAAIFIFAEDDQVWYRSDSIGQPRDNVLLEYGLFASALGQNRAIICRSGNPKEPSDLRGIVVLDISPTRRENAQIMLQAWIQELESQNRGEIPSHDVAVEPVEDGAPMLSQNQLLTASSGTSIEPRDSRVWAIFDRDDYENFLSSLALNHAGDILWFTKTTIWADPDYLYGWRLLAKKKGIADGRLQHLKYIVHFGYWRHYMTEELARSVSGRNVQAFLIYRRKIRTLLENVRNTGDCPPENVQFVVGEVLEPGPLHRFGIYRTQDPSQTLLILGHDTPLGGTALPKLVLRGHERLAGFYRYRFDEQWASYEDQALGSRDVGGTNRSVLLREAFEEKLRQELQWIEEKGG